MKHLSALDALFLHLETPETPMHVGSVMLLERPPGRGKSADPYTRLRDHIARRLHLAPVFTRKLATMPLRLANPAWLREPDIDLAHHVRRAKLPKPGTRAQLESAVAKLHEGVLDRDRPLWQFTVIEGLRGGEVALYAKVHHAALDGQGGIAVAQALLDTGRTPRRAGRGEVLELRPPPTPARLLGAALRNTVAQYGRILKTLPDTVRAVARGGAVALAAPSRVKSGLFGPPTPMNTAIGPRRAFAMQQIPLDEAKAVARHFGVKLNDVVLATCAGALRAHFAKDGEALSRAMVGAVPASLRAPGDTAAANSVTMMRVALATDIADPVKRLNAIAASSTRAKTITGVMKTAIPTDLPSLGLPWLMAAITPLYRKAAQAKRVPALANVAISNVPGPPAALYLAGAKVHAYFPVSIVTHGLALNITIISYDGSLDYGLVAATPAMPDLKGFARRIAAAHGELLERTRTRR